MQCFSCGGNEPWCTYCAAPTTVDCFGQPHVAGRKGTWVQTYLGGKLWPLSPRPEDIHIMDGAVGLARENRYGKQTLRDYSVAEHSVIVSILVEKINPAFAREALLHDYDEGYLPDMPRPLKHEPEMSLEQFRSCGKLILAAAFERFHVYPTAESHAVIDAIDKRLVRDEIDQFMRSPGMYAERHAHVKPIGIKIPGLSLGVEGEALKLFLSRFAELFPEELT